THLDLVASAHHAAKNSHGFTLRSGGHKNQPVVRNIAAAFLVYKDPLRNLQVTQICRDLHVSHHRSTEQHYTPTVTAGSVQNLLYPVHVAREARNHNLAARFGND